jgi:hypothetical protein
MQPIRLKNVEGDASLHQQPRQMLRIRLRLISSLRRCRRAFASCAPGAGAVDEAAWLLPLRGAPAAVDPPAPTPLRVLVEAAPPAAAAGGLRLSGGATFAEPDAAGSGAERIAPGDDGEAAGGLAAPALGGEDDGEPDVPVPV